VKTIATDGNSLFRQFPGHAVHIQDRLRLLTGRREECKVEEGDKCYVLVGW
jgi:hypothetical protein